MAVYAEMKRLKWHCIKGFDIIAWYSQWRYDTWYASLSEEDKAKYAYYLKREKLEKERKARTALLNLLGIHTMCSLLTGDTYL